MDMDMDILDLQVELRGVREIAVRDMDDGEGLLEAVRILERRIACAAELAAGIEAKRNPNRCSCCQSAVPEEHLPVNTVAGETAPCPNGRRTTMQQWDRLAWYGKGLPNAATVVTLALLAVSPSRWPEDLLIGTAGDLLNNLHEWVCRNPDRAFELMRGNIAFQLGIPNPYERVNTQVEARMLYAAMVSTVRDRRTDTLQQEKTNE